MARCVSNPFGECVNEIFSSKQCYIDSKKCMTFENKSCMTQNALPHNARAIQTKSEMKAIKLGKRKAMRRGDRSAKQRAITNLNSRSLRSSKHGIKTKTQDLHACGGCGKSFTSRSELKTHIYCHANEKFESDICTTVDIRSKNRLRQRHHVDHATESFSSLNHKNKASFEAKANFENPMQSSCCRKSNNEDATEIDIWIKQLKANLKCKAAPESELEGQKTFRKSNDVAKTTPAKVYRRKVKCTNRNKRLSANKNKNCRNKDGSNTVELGNRELHDSESEATVRKCAGKADAPRPTSVLKKQPKVLEFKNVVNNHLVVVKLPCTGTSQNSSNNEGGKCLQIPQTQQILCNSDVNALSQLHPIGQPKFIVFPTSGQVITTKNASKIKPPGQSMLKVEAQLPRTNKSTCDYSANRLESPVNIGKSCSPSATTDINTTSFFQNNVHIVNLNCERCKQCFGPDELSAHLLSHAAEEHCMKSLIANRALLHHTSPSTDIDTEDVEVKCVECDLYFKPNEMETHQHHRARELQCSKRDGEACVDQTSDITCEDSVCSVGKEGITAVQKQPSRSVKSAGKILPGCNSELEIKSTKPSVQQTSEDASDSIEIINMEKPLVKSKSHVETQQEVCVLETERNTLKSTSKQSKEQLEQPSDVSVLPDISDSHLALRLTEETPNDLIVLWDKQAINETAKDFADDVIIVATKHESVKFFCANCDKFCKSAQDLQQHEQLHAKQQTAKQTEDLSDIAVVWEKPVSKLKSVSSSPTEDEAVKFFCIQCEDFFKTPTELRSHGCATKSWVKLNIWKGTSSQK